MALKFAVFPLIVLALAAALGASAEERAIALLYATLPTATSAFVLARRMGGDAPTMAAIIAIHTAAAAIVPLWLLMM